MRRLLAPGRPSRSPGGHGDHCNRTMRAQASRDQDTILQSRFCLVERQRHSLALEMKSAGLWQSRTTLCFPAGADRPKIRLMLSVKDAEEAVFVHVYANEPLRTDPTCPPVISWNIYRFYARMHAG